MEEIGVGKVLAIVAALAMIFTGMVGGCMYVKPKYSIYSQRMEGEAELAKARYSKQVLTQEATARKESSALLAEADTIRAHGVARSNQIIGNSLKENESYLRYLWIQNLHEGGSQVIYVPTEANLPILEAGRRGK